MGKNLTTIEAANWIGISEGTMRDWRSDEIGPPYIVVSPRCIRYAMEDLIKWRDERRYVPSVRETVEKIHASL
jgi:hypothetical protein